MAMELYQPIALTGQGVTLYQKLNAFVKESLIEGQHYGKIPNTSKPCLFKGGAELINKEAQLIPEYDIILEKVDFEKPFFAYAIKTRLIREGQKVSEGFGSCSSMEKKYRSDKIDQHFLWNTVLKMAKKRSYVDATITAWGLSGIFTQDMEDLEATPVEKPTSTNIHTRQVPPEYEGNMPNLPPDKHNAQFPPQEKPKLPPLEINEVPDLVPSADDEEFDRQHEADRDIEIARQQALALDKMRRHYFAVLPEYLKNDPDKRHTWQLNLTNKESSQVWTLEDYEKALDAIDILLHESEDNYNTKTLPEFQLLVPKYMSNGAGLRMTPSQRSYFIKLLDKEGYKIPEDLDNWTRGKVSANIDFLKGDIIIKDGKWYPPDKKQ